MEGKKRERPPVSLIPLENFCPVGISLAFLPSLGASSLPVIYYEIKDPSPWKRLSSKSFCTTALHPAHRFWHCFFETEALR